jgi:hypothetical protein
MTDSRNKFSYFPEAVQNVPVKIGSPTGVCYEYSDRAYPRSAISPSDRPELDLTLGRLFL